MPANLTPQYKKAEEEYRRAQTPEEEVRCLERMLQEIPKHKGTDKLQAELKAKISKARSECEHAKKAGKKGGVSHKIPRQGAGRVAIIGGPNAGKSQLLASLTRATPEIAPYPYTTREPHPGMMPWEDVQVQLILHDVTDKGPAMQKVETEQFMQRGDRVLFNSVVFDKEDIDANRKYTMTIKERGKPIAIGNFTLRAEGPHYSGKVEFTDEETKEKRPVQQP